MGSLWTSEELEIFRKFGDKCARCGNSAVTLHEIVPKSKAPKTWMNPKNRIPLCVACHHLAHQHGTKFLREELQELRNRYD